MQFISSYLDYDILWRGRQWCIYCFLFAFFLRRFDRLLANILLSTTLLQPHNDRNFDCFFSNAIPQKSQPTKLPNVSNNKLFQLITIQGQLFNNRKANH